MLVAELEDLHGAYIRLTEKFKALWTFHQFLRGVHHTFLGDTPSYDLDFNGVYDRLREVSSAVTSPAAPDDVRDRLDRIDTELSLATRTLRLADRALGPSLLRRFFDKVKPQDPKIVYHLLRFYFSQPELDDDTADKLDFLVTIAAARPESAVTQPREREDAERLFEAIVSGCSWPAVDGDEAAALVSAMDELAADVAACRSFEDLVRERRVENIRTIKRRLGFALANPRVLASVGLANVRTRSVFHRFFEEERQRIQEAAERIENLEREIAHGGPVPPEFERFRDARRQFEHLQEEANVRAGDLLALKHRISDVLEKFDLRRIDGDEIDDALEIDEDLPSRGTEDSAGALREAIDKVLAAVEMGEGNLKEIGNLGLESWEVRAAKRAIAGNGRAISDRDALLLEGAALRVRAEEDVGQWTRAKKMGRPLPPLRARAEETLRLAADTDRRFAALIHEAGEESLPEEVKALVRSRFRLLYAYSGLWLLHDAEPA
ncbi:MAG TPA: hypothetical protein VFS34_16855 [Thermoanaerobaculia bacterium]|nr:hypothetical protein [Thermoanaerobaculia bacterium]